MVVDFKEVVKVASHVFGGIHGGIQIDAVDIGEGGELWGEGTYLDRTRCFELSPCCV